MKQDNSEHYKKNPIYGTDFSKPLSRIIENIRNELTEARGHLSDCCFTYPGWEERLEPVMGLLTCGLVTLYSEMQERIQYEIKVDDHKFGESLKFWSRGIGRDCLPGCFVCGDTNATNNIAAFVKSREEGLKIEGWFDNLARLDFRESEPNWIQLKVGTCDKHLPNLRWLHDKTNIHGVIRKQDIEEAIKFGLQNESTKKP